MDLKLSKEKSNYLNATGKTSLRKLSVEMEKSQLYLYNNTSGTRISPLQKLYLMEEKVIENICQSQKIIQYCSILVFSNKCNTSNCEISCRNFETIFQNHFVEIKYKILNNLYPYCWINNTTDPDIKIENFFQEMSTKCLPEIPKDFLRTCSNKDFLKLFSLISFGSGYTKSDFSFTSLDEPVKFPLAILDNSENVPKNKNIKSVFGNGSYTLLKISNKSGIDNDKKFSNEEIVYHCSSKSEKTNDKTTYLKPLEFKCSSGVKLIKVDPTLIFPIQRKRDELRDPSKQENFSNIFNDFAKYKSSRTVIYKRGIFSRDISFKDENLGKFLYSDTFGKTDTVHGKEFKIADIKETPSENVLESTQKLRHKIAEIRRRVEKLQRNVSNEMERKELHHQEFIQECQRICDSTQSDYEALYSTKEKSPLPTVSTLPVDTETASSSHIPNVTSSDYLKVISNFVQEIPCLYVTIPVCIVFGVRLAATISRNFINICSL